MAHNNIAQRQQYVAEAIRANEGRPPAAKVRKQIAAMFGCSRSAVNQDIYLTLNPEHPSYPKRRLKLEILERDGRTCQYCGCLLIGSLESSVMEHVIPESQGGPLESYNLVAACFRCNNQKGRNRATWIPRNFSVLQSLNHEWANRILRLATLDFRESGDDIIVLRLPDA
jgi:5-methylcytosine-specific restriction endonuclease McrA